MNRQVRSLKGKEPGPTDGFERIYQTAAVEVDTARRTAFVVKHPQSSHMSSVVMLERTYNVSHFNQIAVAVDADGNQPPNIGVYINQPAFALQNIMEKITTRFCSAVLEDEPHKWLPWYSRLYEKSLESVIRGSGRTFARLHGTKNLDKKIDRRLDMNRMNVQHEERHVPIDVFEDNRDLYAWAPGFGIDTNHTQILALLVGFDLGADTALLDQIITARTWLNEKLQAEKQRLHEEEDTDPDLWAREDELNFFKQPRMPTHQTSALIWKNSGQGWSTLIGTHIPTSRPAYGGVP